MKYLLLVLLVANAWAGPGDDKITVTPTIDGHPVTPLVQTGPDLSHLRNPPHYPGYRYSPSMVPNPDATSAGGSGYTPQLGSEGIAFVGNNLISIMNQTSHSPDVRHLERSAETAQLETKALQEQRRLLQAKIDAGNSESSRRESQRLAEEVARNQRSLDVPISERVNEVANRLIQRKSREAQAKLAHQLREYETTDLNNEIRAWDIFSKEKKATLDILDQFAAEAVRLRDASFIGQAYQDISKASIQAGLTSLTDAAQIAGGHREGSFADALGVSRNTYEIGKAVLDVGLSLTPGVGWAKDCYEAFTGKSMLDGAELDGFGRSFAVLGVVTGGGTTIAKNAFRALTNVGHALHARSLGHGFFSAIHVAETGITNIMRYTPIHEGILHTKRIGDGTGPMRFVSDTFRSGTYIKYTTTEPLTLYRVVGSGVADEAAHMGSYWTRVKPSSSTQSMIDSALEMSWRNDAAKWVEIIVPSGTDLFEGVTASIQRQGAHMSEFIGGGNQVVINQRVLSEWVQKVKEF